MKKKTKKHFPLKWWKSYDDHDNDTWEAPGASSDGDSVDLFYRIIQKLWENKILFTESSDSELRIGTKVPKSWATLKAAKAAMQNHHNSMAAAYKA